MQEFHSAQCMCLHYLCLPCSSYLHPHLLMGRSFCLCPNVKVQLLGLLCICCHFPAFLSVSLVRNEAVGGEEGRARGREGLGLRLSHSLSPHLRTHCPQHTDTSCWHDQKF